jgi:DNA-binding MarR family transcriptional regulator
MTKKESKDAAPKSAGFDPEEARSIGYLSRYMYRMFAKAIAAELAPFGLVAGQWSVLRALWVEEGLSQVDLADRMRVEKASLTTVLEVMDKQGLIRRTRNSSDRRKVNIYLTQKSQRLRDDLLPFVGKINRKATRGMSSAEVDAFRALLCRVIANLEG